MSTNVANYEYVLKEVYAKAISEEFKKNKPLLEKLERNTELWDAGGRYFYVPLALLGNQAVGTVSETGTITAPTQTGTAAAIYYSVNQWGLAQLSKRALDSSTSPEQAWQSLRKMEFASIIEVLRQNINRQLFGDGTGNLTACGVTTASTTVNVASTKYLKKNMHIDIIGASDAIVAQDRTIVSVGTTSIVISGAAVTTDATNYITRSGSNKLETNGLGNLVAASGAVGGVDPATAGNEEWKSYVDSTGGNVSLKLIQPAFDEIEMNGGNVKLLIGSKGVYRAAATYLEAKTRIAVEGTVKLNGGMSGLSWNGVEMFKDNDCPTGYLYFIDYDSLQIAEVTPPGWLDTGGAEGGILHYVTRSLLYEATYVYDMNLIATSRNKLAVIKNIAE